MGWYSASVELKHWLEPQASGWAIQEFELAGCSFIFARLEETCNQVRLGSASKDGMFNHRNWM
jgi:hypothetical protein